MFAYWARVLSDTCNAFKAAASAVQERMDLAEWSELHCPHVNELIAVVTQAAWPSRRLARYFLDSFVNATGSKIGDRDIIGLLQGNKGVM